ncbi:MAG: hypothetical protein M1813_008044 [Trichoglossum hirsutum]|nr:MAG: hypothetical protein M1813_008044 [Trichoglossum hirsutum]
MAAAYGLLLLPSPPVSPSPPSLRAALDPPLTSALARLTKVAAASQKGAVLDIALPCPGFDPDRQNTRKRAQLFESVQRLLAGVYSLLALIYDRDSIDSSRGSGIDARVLLVNYSPVHNYAQDGWTAFSSERLPVSVVELPILAKSHRPWTHLFVVESEPGEEIYKQFMSLATGGIGERIRPDWKLERVRGGLQIRIAGEAEKLQESLERASQRDHYNVAIWGAYDHLHFGHKVLLTMAAFLVEPFSPSENVQHGKIVIGITEEDSLNQKKYAEYVESWEVRQKAVTNFLLAILDFTPDTLPLEASHRSEPTPNGRAAITRLRPYLTIECVAVSSPYGPAIANENVSVVVLSGSSRSDGKAVNELRRAKGWHELDVFEIYVIDSKEYDTDEDVEKAKASSFEAKLGSTDIRKRLSEKLHSS